MKYAFLLVAVVSMGCSEPDKGILTGDLLVVRDCDGVDVIFKDPPYRMVAEFFALEQLGEISFIRMQPGGKPLHRTDALVMEVTDPDFIKNRLPRENKAAIPIPIDSPKVRVTLHVLGSCPTTSQAMTGHEGQITFTKFGTEKGDKVAATFEFELFDDRTGEVVGLGFKGSFSFTVKVGQPYQPFAGQQ